MEGNQRTPNPGWDEHVTLWSRIALGETDSQIRIWLEQEGHPRDRATIKDSRGRLTVLPSYRRSELPDVVRAYGEQKLWAGTSLDSNAFRQAKGLPLHEHRNRVLACVVDSSSAILEMGLAIACPQIPAGPVYLEYAETSSNPSFNELIKKAGLLVAQEDISEVVTDLDTIYSVLGTKLMEMSKDCGVKLKGVFWLGQGAEESGTGKAPRFKMFKELFSLDQIRLDPKCHLTLKDFDNQSGAADAAVMAVTRSITIHKNFYGL